jgi:hypothetical protein
MFSHACDTEFTLKLKHLIVLVNFLRTFRNTYVYLNEKHCLAYSVVFITLFVRIFLVLVTENPAKAPQYILLGYICFS